jgi:hypothetical protein
LAGIGAPIASMTIRRAARTWVKIERIGKAYSSNTLQRGVAVGRITGN